MAPMKFYDIPVELRKKIISYIVRPADLMSLCLTSKAFRDLAVPPLYRRVTLFIGGSADVMISGMLSRTNPGIQHIKKLYLYLKVVPARNDSDDDSSDQSSDEVSEIKCEDSKIAARHAHLTIRMLLDFLPNNILESFRWHDWQPFSIDNWVLLCKKQKNLKYFEIGPLDRSYIPAMDKNPDLLKNFKNLSAVLLSPENLDRLQACQRILQAYPNVRDLQIQPGFRHVGSAVTDLHDASTRPGLLFRTIFSHMLPLESCTPMRLTKLRLENIDVRYAADTYMKAIDFSCLESLTIDTCEGLDAVFSQMTKPHIRPSRLKVLRWFHQFSAEPHAMEALEGLLEGLSGIETLVVDVRDIGGLPKPSAITHHSNTLKVLQIRSWLGPPEQPHLDSLECYTAEQFDEIMTQCSLIRQLSITTPETYVSEPRVTDVFQTFLRSAAKLPNLVTLNIQRWPQTRTSFISSQGKPKLRALEFYRHHLQRLAQQIFEQSDTNSISQGWGFGSRSHLSVIAFGRNGISWYDESQPVRLKQMLYVRGSRIGPLGGPPEMLATRILWKQVRWVEDESNVLNCCTNDVLRMHDDPRISHL